MASSATEVIAAVDISDKGDTKKAGDKKKAVAAPAPVQLQLLVLSGGMSGAELAVVLESLKEKSRGKTRGAGGKREAQEENASPPVLPRVTGYVCQSKSRRRVFFSFSDLVCSRFSRRRHFPHTLKTISFK